MSRRLLLGVCASLLLAGCGTSLSDAAWVWCQRNEPAVADASSRLNLNYVYTQADFAKICEEWLGEQHFAGLNKDGKADDAELAQCTNSHELAAAIDEIAVIAGVKESQGSADGETGWQVRGVAGDALRRDPDYAKACEAAFSAR